jgi:hypothetical protein
MNKTEYRYLNQSNLLDCISFYKATSVDSNQNNKNISGRVPFWNYFETAIYVYIRQKMLHKTHDRIHDQNCGSFSPR